MHGVCSAPCEKRNESLIASDGLTCFLGRLVLFLMNREGQQHESLSLCKFRCILSEKLRNLSSGRKLLRGQPISNRTRCSSLLYSGTYVLVVRTSSRYLCLPYFCIDNFCRVICAICFWAHETIVLFCRSTTSVLM